jgi:translation initiation factor 1
MTGDGIVRLHRETKGRGGKAVTIIVGIPLAGAELKALAKVLKRKCGVGGALKNDTIEIQGDQRLTLKTELEKRGYTVKIAGG